MENPIKQIVRFNQEANLLDKPYNDFLESAYQIEEALEGFDLTNILHLSLPYPEYESAEWLEEQKTPKAVSRHIMDLLAYEQDLTTLKFSVPKLADVDRLDKACDAVVFAVGSMAKLGLDPNQITRALNVVMKANFTKLGFPRDEYGKQTKPPNFVGPESELQRILDERLTND
ncbi:MAG: nucleoside triphosphate pyrophosphohydrolase family protein [Sulfuricurvum sp.]